MSRLLRTIHLPLNCVQLSSLKLELSLMIDAKTLTSDGELTRNRTSATIIYVHRAAANRDDCVTEEKYHPLQFWNEYVLHSGLRGPGAIMITVQGSKWFNKY